MTVKPLGWFNPWNDFHGYQQVAREFEGGEGTIPLYADDAVNASYRAGQQSILDMLREVTEPKGDEDHHTVGGASNLLFRAFVRRLASAIQEKIDKERGE